MLFIFSPSAPLPPPRRLVRKRRDKEEQVAYKLEQEIAMWEPGNGEEVTTDPFKVSRLSREDVGRRGV